MATYDVSTYGVVRGPKGEGISEAQQEQVDAAIQAAEDLSVALPQVEQARSDAVTAAEDAGGSAAAAGEAKDQTEAIAATVDAGFYRRNYVLTQKFSGGIGSWASISTAIASVSHDPPYLMVTGLSSNPGSWPIISEGIFQRTDGLLQVRVEVVCSAREPVSNESIAIRPVLRMSANGTSISETTYPFTAFTYVTVERSCVWLVSVPATRPWFRIDLQFARMPSNVAQIRSISVQNADLERSIQVARKVVQTSGRAEIMASTIGDADEIVDKELGLSYTRGDIQSDINMPIVMADGTRLMPRYRADLRMWAGAPDGQTEISGDGLIVTHSGTDCWTQIVRMLRWCADRDRVAYIPEGDFFATNEGQSGFRDVQGGGLLSVKIKGVGMGRSRILWRDYLGLNGLGRLDFIRLLNMKNIDLEDFSLIGDWRKAVVSDGAMLNGGHLISGTFSGEAHLRNVELSGSHFFAFGVNGGEVFDADGCKVSYCQRDGLHSNVSKHFSVRDSEFYRVFDDAIASHPYETFSATQNVSFNVHGNRLEQCQGIALLGASRANIHDNIGRQMFTRFISVAATESARYQINIHDNQCEDVIDQVALAPEITSGGGGPGCLGISVGSARGSVGFVPAADGEWVFEGGDGGVVKPYDPVKAFADGGTFAPAWGLSIKNNRIYRMLEIGRDWEGQVSSGGEKLWTRLGPVNPTLSRDMVCDLGIGVREIFSNLSLSGNDVFGCREAITIGAEPNRLTTAPRPNRYFHRVSISDNQISGFDLMGVRAYGPGVVSIAGNIIDGDPLFEHPDHAPNGEWTDANAVALPCVAVSVPADDSMTPNVVFQGNKLANLRRPLSRVIPAVLGENVIRGDFVAQADAANKGIRDLQYHPNRLGTLIYEGSDATDVAGFLRVKHVNSRIQDAMPTSGHWIAGTVVDLVVPVTSGSDLVMGYIRLTTGTGHVLGTDWRAILA